MARFVLREKKTLWSASAYAIANFGGTGSHLFFKNDNTLSAADATNVLTTYWLGPIETKGADRLYVQWGGVLGAQAGGLTAVTSSPAFVYAVGLPYYDPSVPVHSQPSVVRATVTQALFDNVAAGTMLNCVGIPTSAYALLGPQVSLSGVGVGVMEGCLYVPDSTDAATGDYTSGYFEVSNRLIVGGAAQGASVYPSIAGIAAVWLAIKVVPSFTDTGDVSGTLTTGKWEALLYEEMPSVLQTKELTRRDLVPVPSAYP